jgi:hypothetical protein
VTLLVRIYPQVATGNNNHHCHKFALPRPMMRLTRNSTKKTTNRIHAICVAVPAIPLKPRTPAINPITKNVIDQFNMTSHLLSRKAI